MKYYMAPLEGITGHIYRTTYAKYFGGIDKYFSPFISPNQKKICRTREKKDILPENNAGLYLVPQIMTNQAEMFLQTVEYLQQFGYNEVNLNLGCPAATVVSRKKGSGFLTEPKKLESFLKEIYEGTNVKISIKSRIGYESAEEFPILLSIFNQFPISELIVHPRTREDFYQNTPDMQAFSYAMDHSKNVLCYNGDIFNKEDYNHLMAQYPSLSSVMLGRGILQNPAVIASIKGEKLPKKETIKEFVTELCERYQSELYGEMKELWYYLIQYCDADEKIAKKIKKAQRISEYEITVKELFSNYDLKI